MASLGQLTAGIAHEIKNPLNFVNNFAGLSVELLDELRETAGPAITALDKEKHAEIDETIEMLTGNLEKIAEHGTIVLKNTANQKPAQYLATPELIDAAVIQYVCPDCIIIT
jgi:signal transduction histidine kinase